MSFAEFMDHAGIEILVFGICMFFGIRLIVTKDVAIIQKQFKDSIKQPEEYAVHAGYLILFLGVAALIMAGLSFINYIAAAVWMVLAVVVMSVFWKKIYDKYN
ncbi:MAG: hypothetical protein K6G10_11145 [Butyrivibrio sp.]|nr:hypothetical protein [Butyrivibrio sp.]